MRLSKTQIGLFVALLVGNATILFGNLDWTWLRLPAAFTLTFVLPGWAWLPALGWMKTGQVIERMVLVVGLSSLLASLALFIIVLLPGPFTETPLLIALSITSLGGLIFQSAAKAQAPISGDQSKPEWPSRTTLFILLAIIAVAAFTRLPRLGYAEFHEDELENMRLIVRAYKGEEYVPFIDSKGPIHWLLPAALWYGNGWVNEGIARLPFALTSLTLVPLMYALGRRMSDGRDSIGLLAAGFVSLNGFFVALARHVENRALIVFWGALAVWFAYRYYKEGLKPFLLYTALTLAMGLIAHPNVLLYLPAVIFIIGAKVYHSRGRRQHWPWLIGGAGLFMGLTALFYLPYLTGPDINLVYQYFAEERVGTAFLYNRVDNMFSEDKLYSSRYHGPVLLVLLVWLLARNFARVGRPGQMLFGVLGLAIMSTLLWPEAWIINNLNLAFAPYALLTLAVLLLPTTNFEIKANFLWFSVPFGALLFLAQDASNHIQIAYTGLVLLAVFGLADLWTFSGVRAHTLPAIGGAPGNNTRSDKLTGWRPALRVITVLILVITGPLIVYYQHLLFGVSVTTYWQAKIDYTYNPDSIYNYLYGTIPRPRKVISNPRLGGWKAVGYLWATGGLSGDFRSVNESFAVPIWYTFQTPRSCYTDPQHYWLRRDWQGWPQEEQTLGEQGYTLTGIVLVDRQPKLHLYQKNAPADLPQIMDMDAYRHAFDRLATPARFAQADSISRPVSLNFGNKLLLRGYNLPPTGKIEQVLPVTVYWESLAPMDVRYRAFVHLLDAAGNRQAQHDDDPACRLLTTEMRPGQRSSRQFRLPLAPTTMPGEYTVVLGIYQPDTLARLDIWDNLTQQSSGDSLVLGQVRVE